jgi:alpha-L-fucosidase
MNKHEEAIYESRAYSTFGYGEAEIEEGHFGGQSATIDYNKNDIRFTVSKDKKHLYVFSLGLPDPKADLRIRTPIEAKVKGVSVLGSGVDLKWSVTDNILTLTTPDASDMDELATVFKIDFD